MLLRRLLVWLRVSLFPSCFTLIPAVTAFGASSSFIRRGPSTASSQRQGLQTRMIQPSKKDETAALMSVAEASGLFEPSQTDELSQMLERHFNDPNGSQEIWLTHFDDSDEPIGMAYIAPERMTEGTWNLLLIAIHPSRQKQGYGKVLLQHIEEMLKEQGERILLVETSGTDDFDYVRSFYRINGYDEEARIREFYAAGVDKVIFRKALNLRASSKR